MVNTSLRSRRHCGGQCLAMTAIRVFGGLEMRRISMMTTTFGLALLVSSTGFAADQYTYRAGQVYMKASADNHTECEAQCRGDAACRGWNFIRPNPRSRSGICEFNARKAAPVSSPISISGEINTGIDALMSHAVPLTGNMAGNMRSNTVRVGTPIVPKREIPKRRIAATPQMAAVPTPGARRIVKRLPVPGLQKVPTSADYKRTIPAQTARARQDVRAPRVYGGEAPRIQARPQTRQQPIPQPQQQRTRQQQPQQMGLQQLQRDLVQPREMQKRQMTREQIYREQMLAAQRQMAERQAEQAQNNAQQQIPQPSQYAPNPYAPNSYAPNPYAQPYPQQMRRQAPQQAPIMQAPPQAQMMPAPMAPNQASLYGSLHDDLTQNMTSVPRPQTAPDQMGNADAPVSTSRAAPVQPVQSAPIGYPAIPGLAGG